MTINWHYDDVQTLNPDHRVVELVLGGIRHGNKSLVTALEGGEVRDKMGKARDYFQL